MARKAGLGRRRTVTAGSSSCALLKLCACQKPCGSVVRQLSSRAGEVEVASGDAQGVVPIGGQGLFHGAAARVGRKQRHSQWDGSRDGTAMTHRDERVAAGVDEVEGVEDEGGQPGVRRTKVKEVGRRRG